MDDHRTETRADRLVEAEHLVVKDKAGFTGASAWNVSALPTRTLDDYGKAVVDAARGLEDYLTSERWRQMEKRKKLTMIYAVVDYDPAYGLRAAAFTTREEAALFKAYLLQNEIHAVGVQEIVVHESALDAIEEPI